MGLQLISGKSIGEVEDPRRGFQLIRRQWIHRYFRDHGIQYNPILPVSHLISICEVHEITAIMVAQHSSGLTDKATQALSPNVTVQEKRIAELERLVEAMAKTQGVTMETLQNSVKENEVVAEPTNYKDLDMASIRKLTKTLGIVAERTDTKENLIEKIEAYGKDIVELDERSPEANQPSSGSEPFKYAV